MKFIRMMQHNEQFYKSPPENLAELLVEHTAWLTEQKRTGKCLEAFLLAGNAQGDRTIQLWDFDSPEDVDRCIWEDPMGFTFKWEVYPAVDVFPHMETILASLEKGKK